MFFLLAELLELLFFTDSSKVEWVMKPELSLSLSLSESTGATFFFGLLRVIFLSF